MTATLRRLSAFTAEPSGGNPAGVWIGDELPDPEEMLAIAADVGYSETAFLARQPNGRWLTRYYSPVAEVPFCGHATIASGTVLGERFGSGRFVLETAAGEVPVDVDFDGGLPTAALTSVEPRYEPASSELVSATLEALGWGSEDIDHRIPPARAFAGAWHLVLSAISRQRLADLDYDFDALRDVMLESDLTTVQIVWRENATTFHSRNPFPVGGVVEDPATGASAAALGGYLRDKGLIDVPARLTVRQGEDMGRPSLLIVDVPERGGIVVSGSAVDIPS